MKVAPNARLIVISFDTSIKQRKNGRYRNLIVRVIGRIVKAFAVL